MLNIFLTTVAIPFFRAESSQSNQLFKFSVILNQQPNDNWVSRQKEAWDESSYYKCWAITK